MSLDDSSKAVFPKKTGSGIFGPTGSSIQERQCNFSPQRGRMLTATAKNEDAEDVELTI